MYVIVAGVLFVLLTAIFAAYALDRHEKGNPLYTGYDKSMSYFGTVFGILVGSFVWPFSIPASIIGYTIYAVTRTALKKKAVDSKTN